MDLGAVSVVLPAKNEAPSLRGLLPRVQAVLPPGGEIVVVDDGSSDDTADVAIAAGARVVRHPVSLGNGAAIKSGARAARGDVIVFMDADGQHPPEAIPTLLGFVQQGYDLVVGARDRTGQASVGRWLANSFYNRFASWMAGTRIADLTSGLRAVRAQKFRQVLGILPNRFSYPTTSTMAFLKLGYAVCWHPVAVGRRDGRSHIAPFRDGARFVLIIFKIATLFSPLKIFFPAALACWGLGLANYAYTYFSFGRFTNMSALLLSSGVLVFLMGLLAEQVCMLTYAQLGRDPESPTPR